MTTVFEVVNFAKDLADRRTGVNYDGAYGMQCVDLPNWICGKFFGKALWGNAIDLIKSAKQHGFEVHYMPTSERPRQELSLSRITGLVMVSTMGIQV